MGFHRKLTHDIKVSEPMLKEYQNNSTYMNCITMAYHIIQLPISNMSLYNKSSGGEKK